MMAEDLDKLEREIERELARWAHRLDSPPGAEVVQSVRAAVRRELGEAWLAVQPFPSPPPEVLERVRAAVATELMRRRAGGRLLRWVSAPAWGSLGAAAMLTLCFGLIWYASTLSRPRDSSAELEILLVAVSESPVDPIQTEVQLLEARLPEDEAFPEGDGESLGELVEELDRLLESQDLSRATFDRDGRAAGVLG